jgi:hypothetical protein
VKVAQSGHGRVNPWRIHAFALEALSAESDRGAERADEQKDWAGQRRKPLLPEPPRRARTPPAPWLGLIRGHWGGVENRNPGWRDALMGEDGSRSRNATLLANLALLRNVLLHVMAPELETQSLPQWRERLHSHPGRCLALLTPS